MGAFESSRTFFKPVADLEPVARDVADHFRRQGYDVKSDPRMSGAWDVSITKSNLFRAVCGLRTALKIEIVPQGDAVSAKAGVGIFGQQAIPTAITLFLFWPVIIPQIWGLVAQSKLDDEALQVISESLDRHASQQMAPLPVTPSARFCMACGGAIPPGSAFCPSCGARQG